MSRGSASMPAERPWLLWAFALAQTIRPRTIAKLVDRFIVTSIAHPSIIAVRLGVTGVVPDPPLVRRSLWIALGRVFPLFLSAERGEVEIVPGVAHLLIAAVLHEVRAEHAIVIADERVRAMPLSHAEIGIERVRQRVPGLFPTHARFHACDFGTRRTRHAAQRRVAPV